jgi:hypothetical protein
MMENKRKIEMVGGKVSFANDGEDEDDLLFWARKTIKERMEDAFEWKKRIWTHVSGSYPLSIEKIGGKMAKKLIDEDDF